MIKNAPFKFAEFENITIKAGSGGYFDKIFSSKTGDYEYINNQDSLVKQKVKLSKDDLLYLHRKAVDLGFWNMSKDMIADTSGKSPRYFIEYDYQRKKKIVEIDAAYNGDMKVKGAALELIETINKTINIAADKNK
ncbi:hypothetical protein [Pedobacter arcticus]|uniref:hypothetical protein n=1 Tax=Pedobacter arcticus TaxID=752140 RepID=UPI0003603773|nr:hypothetical protein [Pedobacter arcticus]